MTINTTFTPLTDPPDSNDPANFDTRADNLFNVELPRLVNVELASFVPEVNATQVAINLSESNAATSEANALVSETNANNWAVKLNQLVLGTDYSAKEWAIGTFVPQGSSKDWAVQITTKVDGVDYSAKEWAIGTGVTDGSAKFWAGVAQTANDFQGLYSELTTYTLGQVVVNATGRYYVSLVDNNLGNLLTDKAFWVPLSNGGADNSKLLFFGSF